MWVCVSAYVCVCLGVCGGVGGGVVCIRLSEEGLQEEECAHVYTLVFASHRGLAAAAGSFLYHK